MKSFWTIVCILIFGLSLAGASQIDTLTIDNDYTRKIKGSVILSHGKHSTEYGIECSECHHDIGDSVDPRPCIDCHTVDSAKILKLKNAFHKNCKDCHKEMGGPIKCNDCHEKKEK